MKQTDSVHLMPGAEMRLMLQKKPSKGILLLHGFLGNPAEMAWLGEQLFAAGYSVHIPRYPGHGTTLREMTRTSARQWYIAAREAWLELNRYCDDVYIAGLSMGGLFTMLLAAEFKPAKIATISMPHRMRSVMAYTSYILWPVMSILWSPSKDRGINDPEARARHVCYDQGLPLRQVTQLIAMCRRMRRTLPRVTAKALIVQSRGDTVIPENSADYVVAHIGSQDVRLHRVERSNHAVTVDYDRVEVAETVITFFNED